MKSILGLYLNVRGLRKLLKIGRFFEEYRKIQKRCKNCQENTLKCRDTISVTSGTFSEVAKITARCLVMIYWLIDGITGISIFKSVRYKHLSYKLWLWGVLLQLIPEIANYISVRQQSTEIIDTNMRNSILKGILSRVKANIVLEIIRNLGNGFTACQKLGYPKRYLGFNIN